MLFATQNFLYLHESLNSFELSLPILGSPGGVKITIWRGKNQSNNDMTVSASWFPTEESSVKFIDSISPAQMPNKWAPKWVKQFKIW